MNFRSMDPLRNLQILIVETHESVKCQRTTTAQLHSTTESKHRMCGRQHVAGKSPGVGIVAKLSLLQ